jgi:hypothetical protein
MLLIPFPGVLSPTVQNWWLDARTRSGGETVVGREQVVSTGLLRWRATLSFPLFNRQTILAFRAWIVQMEGRGNRTLIGPCDCSNGNRLAPVVGGIPHSDGTMHSDGAGYAQGGTSGEVVALAAVGTNQVRIYNGSTVLPVLAGSFIGLGDYLYVITAAAPQPGNETVLTITPKLRAAVPIDTPVEWCRARCPMRLMADDSGAFDLNLGRYGTANLDLVEVW